MTQGAFKDILTARQIRLTESKNDNNANYWDYGNKILLPIHYEYLKEKAKHNTINKYNSIMENLQNELNKKF